MLLLLAPASEVAPGSGSAGLAGLGCARSFPSPRPGEAWSSLNQAQSVSQTDSVMGLGLGSGCCHSLGCLSTFAQVGAFFPSKASPFRHKAFSAPTSPAARPGSLGALAIRAGASSWNDGWGHVIARQRVDFVCV